MRILLTNDDGIFAPGIQALADGLSSLGEVTVVAPDREQSATSHSISLHRPLRIEPMGERRFAVDGTPTDCVYLAIHHLLRDARPDVLISGINLGANVGDDLSYSGTVAGAIEGALLGVPSFAISLVGRRPPWNFGAAVAFARALTASLSEAPLPRHTLLNVNVPADGDPRRFRLTRQGIRGYGGEVIEQVDPRGRRYYWIGGEATKHEDIPGSDCNAVFDERVISVTPVKLDLTHEGLLGQLATLSVPGFERVGA